MNRLTSIRVLTAALTLVGASALTDAQAQIVSVTPYTPIYQGISEATATIQASAGTAFGYVMQINLDAPGIGFTTTPLTAGGSPGGSVETRSQTTAQFLQSSGAQVAINANFFNNCCSTTTPANETFNGLAISNGKGGATNLNNSGTKDIGADLGIYAAPLAPVPLPAAVWLFGSGLMGLLGFGRRRRST